MRGMKNLLAVAALMLFSASVFGQAAPTAVAPLNSVGVATGCVSRASCSYEDVNVPPGPHFYFIVAVRGSVYSKPSNRVDVTVPAGTHSVALSWDPDPTAVTTTYFIYRGAPATNLAPKVN